MATLITLIEGMGLGALLYILLRTLKGIPGERRTATWKMALAAVGGPLPLVGLVWALRAGAGNEVSLIGLVALWAVLGVVAAGVGLWAQSQEPAA